MLDHEGAMGVTELALHAAVRDVTGEFERTHPNFNLSKGEQRSRCLPLIKKEFSESNS